MGKLFKNTVGFFLSSQVCCNDFYTKILFYTIFFARCREQILIQILISLQFLFTQLLGGENQTNTKLLWFTEKTLKHCLVVEVWSCNVKQTNFELSVLFFIWFYPILRESFRTWLRFRKILTSNFRESRALWVIRKRRTTGTPLCTEPVRLCWTKLNRILVRLPAN